MRTEIALRSGSQTTYTPQKEQPRVAQGAFVALYAALWVLGWVQIPGIGRPEKILVLIGLAALPRAVGSRTMPSQLVTAGVFGMLGTYFVASVVSGIGQDSVDLMISLAARVLFLWMCFVLLQSAWALRLGMELLMLSSLFAAAVALAVMARHGVGVGRISPQALEETLVGPVIFSIFASSQLATMGGILLIGSRGLFKSLWAQIGAPVGGLVVCAVAYLSYFRREHLISIPLVLLALVVAGNRETRKKLTGWAVVAIVGFLAVVAWDYMRADSVLGSRIESELAGNFVQAGDTRLTNFYAQLKAIADSPVFGYGAGRHSAAILPFVLTNERFLAGFNILGWLAVEGGVFCALFYLMMLIGMWRVAWKWRSIPGNEPHAVVLRCAPALVAQVVLWGIFGNAWDLPLGWFVLGMILAAATRAELDAGGGSRFPGRVVAYRGSPMPAALEAPSQKETT